MADISTLEALPFESVSEVVPQVVGAPSTLRLVRQELAPAVVVEFPGAFCLAGPYRAEHLRLAAAARWPVEAPFCARALRTRVLGRGLLLDDDDRLLVSRHFHAWAPPGHPLRREILWDWVESDRHQPPGAEAQLDPERLVPRRLAGSAVLLAQPGSRVFGHWLAEILPRAAVAVRLGLGGARFLLSSPVPAFAPAFLGLLGIPRHAIEAYDQKREIVSFDEIFVPSRLFDGTAYSPLAAEIFGSVRRAVIGDLPAAPWRKVFVSRRKWHKGRHSNRDELVPRLRAHGFDEVWPEDLPLAEQIRMFAEATHVVAEEGSAAHLTLFAPPGAKVLLLSSTMRAETLQSAIAALMRQPLGYLFGEAEDDVAVRGVANYRIAPDSLEEILTRHFG